MKIKGRFSIILLLSLSLTFDNSIVAISRMRVTYGPDNGVAHQGVSVARWNIRGRNQKVLGGLKMIFPSSHIRDKMNEHLPQKPFKFIFLYFSFCHF